MASALVCALATAASAASDYHSQGIARSQQGGKPPELASLFRASVFLDPCLEGARHWSNLGIALLHHANTSAARDWARHSLW